MPTCTECGADFAPGTAICPQCGGAAVDGTASGSSAAAEAGWVPVYTGSGVEIGLVEDALAQRGIDVVQLEVEELGANREVGIFGTSHVTLHTLAVPADQHAARSAEIEAALAEVTGRIADDPGALAEAEEDYDVRGCPSCGLYFHETYSACPGTSEPLVPAVECFSEGQLAPERVVVADGQPEGVEPLAERLRGAGFQARTFTPPGWAVALVDLPWPELTDRTAEAERVLRGEPDAARDAAG